MKVEIAEMEKPKDCPSPCETLLATIGSASDGAVRLFEWHRQGSKPWKVHEHAKQGPAVYDRWMRFESALAGLTTASNAERDSMHD